MKTKNGENMDNVTIIASQRNWIDSRSVETLRQIAHFHGVERVVGLPDLSVGNVPNGMAITVRDRIYPHLIGGDIGCGMSLYATTVKGKNIKVDKFAKHLSQIESLDFVEDELTLGYHLGSIGKGNHFAELHQIDRIWDEAIATELSLDKNLLYLLIHSGSRAFGQMVFDRVSGSYEANCGIDSISPEAKKYLESHDKAIAYARLSRHAIARRLMKAIKMEGDTLLISDTAHNSITQHNGVWLHRKGATPTDCGAVIIAGSRGSLSYLVQPTPDSAHSNHSLAHGAGRKWERNSAKGKLSHKYTRGDLERTPIGSRVICKESKLLYEEAPQAYKNIDIVVDDLVSAGLAVVIATFRPILTYKE